MKPTVPEEGSPEIAQSNQGYIPRPVGPEDASDGRDELHTAVADAGVAELTEVGEVLADLSVGEAEFRSQLRRTHRFPPPLLEPLEFAQVETQATDDRSRNRSRRLRTVIRDRIILVGGLHDRASRGSSASLACSHDSREISGRASTAAHCPNLHVNCKGRRGEAQDRASKGTTGGAESNSSQRRAARSLPVGLRRWSLRASCYSFR